MNQHIKQLLKNKDKLSKKEQIELIKIVEHLQKEECKTNYAAYVEYVHEGRWLPAKHLLYICNKVQDFLNNELNNKSILIIQCPPQHGKSQSVTESLPSWYLGNNPTHRVIEVSYGDDLAQRFGRRNKDKIERFGKELFNIEISKKTSAATEFELSNNIGSMLSRGIGSGITGQAADLILIDDPVKNRQEADSETYRNRIYDEWLNSLKTRLSAKGKVILIMTRWHEDDLAGRIIKEEGNKVYTINLPCEAEENDILGRNVGDSLFPEIGKDNIWLEDYKKSYQTSEGNRAWLALFQGRPTSAEGNMVKREWWKYYKILPQLATKIISVDATFKDGANNDFVSIQVWGKVNANIYLIDNVKARMDFPTTIQAIRNIKNKHNNIDAIYIEDKANGSAIISTLRKEISGIIPVQPHGSKEARVSAISPQIEAGNVYVPEDAPWIHDYVEEWSSFPNGKHDDQVDGGSQAILKLKDRYAIHQVNNNYDDEDNPSEDYLYKNLVENVTGGYIPNNFF
jgi:predicted phage terminase large subunit-like protein